MRAFVHQHSPQRQVAAAAGLSALPLSAAGLLGWAAGEPLQAVRAPGPASVDELVALAAATLCGAYLAAAALGALLTVLVTLAHRGAGDQPPALRGFDLRGFDPRGFDLRVFDRLAGLVTPRFVRRLAGLALGVSLVGTTIGPSPAALAAPRPPARQATPTINGAVDRPADTATERLVARSVAARMRPGSAPPERGALARGWSPDRPAVPRRTPHGGAGVHLVTTAPRAARHEEGVVVVRRGDTLWDIAARALGPGASAGEIAAAWPRWHHANYRTIGADPGLVKPGQRLRPPPTSAPQPSDAADTTTREESP